MLVVYVFLYGRLYLVLSGLEEALSTEKAFRDNKPLQVALASQSFVQIGLLLALPMIMEIGLERGFGNALCDFILMQIQLAPVFFTFSLGTRTHYFGRTLLHGGAEYRGTGRGFVVFHAKFAENYRLYSRSHFVKGFELMFLLLVYHIFGQSYGDSVPYILIMISIWFMVVTWLFAPFLFNPSGFEWQKIVDDWNDWNKWISNRGGIGVSPDKSWESWWEKEQLHLRHSGKRGIAIEILLSLRFFLFQYGLVYRLNITKGTRSVLVNQIHCLNYQFIIYSVSHAGCLGYVHLHGSALSQVYGASWLVIIGILLVMKVKIYFTGFLLNFLCLHLSNSACIISCLQAISVGRRRFSADYQLLFRIIKCLIFLTFFSVFITLLAIPAGLKARDIIVCILAFGPTGWGLLQVATESPPRTC